MLLSCLLLYIELGVYGDPLRRESAYLLNDIEDCRIGLI